VAHRADDIAARSSWPELAVGSAFLLAGATMLGVALLWRRIPPPLAHLFFYLAGFALVIPHRLCPSARPAGAGHARRAERPQTSRADAKGA
jgi:hypothetical protein